MVPVCGAGKTLVVKMATLAPDGSPWHEILVEMGQQWYEVTGGEVQLRIYPGGVAGDERHMIRKIRIGQIHAAAVTVEGLTEISRDMNVFFIPLLVSSFEELDALRDEMEPQLLSELERNGFKLLSWADVGWAYWFTREPIRTPQDLMDLRIFSWAGDYRWTELWKLGGFQPVSLASIDVLPSLQTGLVDAFATAPIVALSMQWFALAPYMLKLKWGPLIGAVIIGKKTWDAIPAEYHPDLLEIAKHTEDRARSLLPQARKALDAMQAHGLEIHIPSQEERDTWLRFTRSFYPHLRGNLIPEGIFDRAIELQKQLSVQKDQDN
ncbi:MAG: TRAP transporter substrate-binding protein DctP [Candidatus Neomarinimicrobiota bacterium]